jgi:hypothetical protein
VGKSPKLDALGRKAGPFSANSGFSLPPPPLKVRGREYVLSSMPWESIVFCIFWPKMSHKILTIFCAIFPAATAHQSTGKEREIKPTWERSSPTNNCE